MEKTTTTTRLRPPPKPIIQRNFGNNQRRVVTLPERRGIVAVSEGACSSDTADTSELLLSPKEVRSAATSHHLCARIGGYAASVTASHSGHPVVQNSGVVAQKAQQKNRSPRIRKKKKTFVETPSIISLQFDCCARACLYSPPGSFVLSSPSRRCVQIYARSGGLEVFLKATSCATRFVFKHGVTLI